uniref:Uncharacterized protein n=1 Tax=Anopheles culicifacies TaxID=139723 RepID=A0A182M8C6_9DIPT
MSYLPIRCAGKSWGDGPNGLTGAVGTGNGDTVLGRGFFASPLSETVPGEEAAEGDEDALLLLPDAVSARPTVVSTRLVGLVAVAMLPLLPPTLGELFTVTIVVPWCNMAVDDGDRLLVVVLDVWFGSRLVDEFVLSAAGFVPGCPDVS